MDCPALTPAIYNFGRLPGRSTELANSWSPAGYEELDRQSR